MEQSIGTSCCLGEFLNEECNKVVYTRKTGHFHMDNFAKKDLDLISKRILYEFKTDVKVKNFFNFLIFEHGLIPVINKPTRITKKSATAIDHIITNSFLKNDIKTGIIKTDTYHFPIFIVSSKPDIDVYSTEKFIFKRYINDETMNNFKNKLNEINWEIIKNIESPESAYNLFLQQFSAAYENAFPKVKIKIKIKNLLSPWAF